MGERASSDRALREGAAQVRADAVALEARIARMEWLGAEPAALARARATLARIGKGSDSPRASVP